jgi:mRNA interferase RelE/StbE
LSVDCSVELTELAKEDFSNLPEDIKQDCYNTLKKLEKNLNMGLELKNNGIRDLSDCYKLYFFNAKYRIIYMKENKKITVHQISIQNVNIAKVLGIGKRANYEIYDIVAERLHKFINK